MGESYGSPPLGRGGGGFSFRLPSLWEGRGWVQCSFPEKNIGKGVLFANKCVNLLSLQILITKWKS